ncbi:MAG: hypothetical protein P8I55_01785 [Crocinitomix sp.]|nr:hypothetical protein [Crocinitomix sp.]
MAGADQIKNLFINKKIRRDPKRKPVLKGLDRYHEILFIADTDQSQRLNELTSIFKHAKISFLYARKEKEDKSAHGNYSYHLSDLNLTGKIKNDKLNQMMQKQFDLILDLSTDTVLNQFLLKKISSTFIIGKKGIEKSEMYDLLVDEKVEEKTFIETVTQQIKLLSQNGNK